MNRIIMNASDQDADEILALYRAQIGEPFCAWTDGYPTKREITYDLERNALFIMKENEKIIAAISIDQDEKVEALSCWSDRLYPGRELSRLVVDKAYQNQGIARQMLLYGMEKIKESGCKSVHFLVSKHNQKALRSYEHLHFNNVGETELFEHDYWCYEKEL